MVTFSTPSHNINCWLDDDPGSVPVRCDVLNHTWAAPTSLRPKNCTGDYGSTLNISAGRASFACASDAIGPSPVLAYGTGIDVGPMRCISLTSGMRCLDRDTGHGFLVSRGSISIF